MNAKIHPQTIITGWRLATDCARATLTRIARDNSGDKEKFNEVSVKTKEDTNSIMIFYWPRIC